MKCPHCGKEVSEDTRLCPGCGQRLKKGFTPEERQKYIDELKTLVKEEPARKTKWFWVGVALLSISVVWWALCILAGASGQVLWTQAIGTALSSSAVLIGIGVPCMMKRVPPIEKSPWGRGTLVVVSLLASFAAAGIIAGLNWRRMGRHQLMWITIIVSSIAFVFVGYFINLLVGADSSRIGSIATLVNVGIAWGLWGWQKSDHWAWEESHLQAERAGWQIPVLVVCVVVMLVGGNLLFFGL